MIRPLRSVNYDDLMTLTGHSKFEPLTMLELVAYVRYQNQVLQKLIEDDPMLARIDKRLKVVGGGIR